jgi:hypothetical protein
MSDDEKARAGLFREIFAEQLKVIELEARIFPPNRRSMCRCSSSVSAPTDADNLACGGYGGGHSGRAAAGCDNADELDAAVSGEMARAEIGISAPGLVFRLQLRFVRSNESPNIVRHGKKF